MNGEYGYRIPPELIAKENEALADDLERDCEALQEGLRRSGLLSSLGTDLERLTEHASRLDCALPAWCLSGPGPSAGAAEVPAGMPGDIFEALVDCDAVQRLSGAVPRTVLRLPGHRVGDPHRILEFARTLGIGFASMDPETEAGAGPGAVSLCLECIESGKALGAESLAVPFGGA